MLDTWNRAIKLKRKHAINMGRITADPPDELKKQRIKTVENRWKGDLSRAVKEAVKSGITKD
jgi:hypothetical protein